MTPGVSVVLLVVVMLFIGWAWIYVWRKTK
jgi:hypothetical protein